MCSAHPILHYPQAPASPAEAEALAFADAWITYATEQLQEHGTDFVPTVHFLPGVWQQQCLGCLGCGGGWQKKQLHA